MLRIARKGPPAEVLRRLALAVAGVMAALVASGCAVNPVTGEREIVLMGVSQQIQSGEANYAPAQQMQGGVFTADPDVLTYVREVGQRMAAVSDTPLPYEFTVLNSSVPNAWAMPGGKIAINRGLLTELESEAQLAAVLGHEVVHAAAGHGANAYERGLLLQGLMVGGALATAGSEYGGAAMQGGQLLLGAVNQKYTRDAERESDEYGMKYMVRAGYDPAAAVQLQETFVRLSGDRKQDWLSGLFASHPPSEERVQNNKRLLAELPKGGEQGKAAYQKRLAFLFRNADAYKELELGRKALAENKLDAALAHAEKGLQLTSEEPGLHALRGDVRLLQKQPKDALINYDRAVARDPGYFLYHLRRGQAQQALGEYAAASNELQRSISLLPTATAMASLGQIALAQGDRKQAIQWFGQAAQSDSADGKAAQVQLVRLDLADNPGQYLQARTGLGTGGNLLVQVGNPTGVTADDVVLGVAVTGADGQTRQFRQAVGRLPAGQQVTVDTGVVPGQGASAQAQVIAAQPVDS